MLLSALFSLTLIGTVTGQGVTCPQIKTNDGVIHALSHLPSWAKPGTMVKVKGTKGASMTCQGKVIIVKSVETVD